jgi:hypothetical protein
MVIYRSCRQINASSPPVLWSALQSSVVGHDYHPWRDLDSLAVDGQNFLALFV